MDIFKNWLTWYWRSTKSRLTKNGRATYKTMISICQHFFSIYIRKTGADIKKAERDELTAHIQTLGAEKKTLPKHDMDLDIFESIQRQQWIWAFQSYKRTNPVSISFALKCMLNTDCRPGAIMRDPEYPQAFLKYEVC
jgi:hypothetical protein